MTENDQPNQAQAALRESLIHYECMSVTRLKWKADACATMLEAEDRLLISAGTVAESLIVAGRRDVREEVDQLIDGLGFEIVSVTPASARRIAKAYETWGKGMHPVALN